MKEYNNPNVEILKLNIGDVLMASGEPASNPDDENGTPFVSLL